MAVREFDAAPATLPMYVRAALPALPVVGALPGIKHTGDAVPDLTLTRTDVLSDPDHLARYAGVCGFRYGGRLPVTYPHLAAFGLQMALMGDTSFPFTPMGLVHLRNSITQHRPIDVTEPYDIAVRADGLRPHPKGRLIDLVTKVRIGDVLVWEETMTLFSRGRVGAGEETSPSPLAEIEAPSGPARWRLPSDLGRRYAAVSGDWNPIHLYGLTAKAFGFPRQIAHGMWTKARCLAALEGRLPDAYTVDVEFKKPILLPASVTFGAEDGNAGATVFGVTSPTKTHLVGRLSPP